MNKQKTNTAPPRSLNYTIQVNASPYENEAADIAYGFAKALLAKGHRLHRVFFYRDGVYHALGLSAPPADEVPKVRRWSDLAAHWGVDLVICSAAAQRRGVWSSTEEMKLAEGFRVAGLALLVESILKTDRFMVFS